MRNGEAVAQFERQFAQFVGARYAVAMCNGTATLHSALAALDVRDGLEVAVPPLTMSSTTLAVIHAGGTPRFVDVDPDTWVMQPATPRDTIAMPVALYGLHDPAPNPSCTTVLDAAQTLAPHRAAHRFTSYSFQASKILQTSEGGMLVTNDGELAARARSFASLGYPMLAEQPRIDPAMLKRPDYARHVGRIGYNYRMSDLVARYGSDIMSHHDVFQSLRLDRVIAASVYRDVVSKCAWLKPQLVPSEWWHDYWTYAVFVEEPVLPGRLVERIVAHGGERPYAAWRLAYKEPAIEAWLRRRSLSPARCPVAERLQPRLLQFQTNDLKQAERNVAALAKAIKDVGG